MCEELLRVASNTVSTRCGVVLSSTSRRSNSPRVMLVRAVISVQLTASAGLVVLCWARELIKRREEHGACTNLLKEIQIEHAQQYGNFTRMTAENLEVLLLKIGSQISKMDTVIWKAVPAKDRLLVTLRFLASGKCSHSIGLLIQLEYTYSSLQYLYRIPKCTIGRIVMDVCAAIYSEMKDEYLQFPRTAGEWNDIADVFENFLILLVYYNYKGTYNIVLMAFVDAQYRFTHIDVRCNGRVSDGVVFGRSALYHALESGELPLPPPKCLPGRSREIPNFFFFVADDAFALRRYIMKPYPFRGLSFGERVFNYRVSRARRVVEN
ncbi:hypothetical protein PR048_003318 [Dryococelus australis]|uniref:DDE Tnp4 domain-containing protein n=1 Tax=Dryococelus australis TaxID=614101 RepID=A0ABQ9IMP7_9NEOP|nr:hypothetical protein PR048_003318 [Dryococelus australis]